MDPAKSSTRTWRPGWPCEPLDILRSLRRGGRDPAFQRDPDGAVWRSARTPEGAVTVRVRLRRSLGEVELAAWGDGSTWMLDAAPAMLGGSDDVSQFSPRHPRVQEVWRRHPHWRIGRSGLVLESLVAAVIEQKVTGQEAWLGWRRLLVRHGNPAPGPGAGRGMWVLPTPRALSLIPSWEWLRCSIDPARSSTIVAAARRSAALERTVGMPSVDVERRLCSVPGIGVWTAAEVRQRAHGDPDAVSFGDYHVASHIGWALTGAKVDDNQLTSLLEADRPHRYRVQYLVTTRLPGPPRRGPRSAPRRHLPR